jgi:hypothetical protein
MLRLAVRGAASRRARARGGITRLGELLCCASLNSAGQQMEVSGILLVANMADGSVEQIAMGAQLEPGLYRGTVATGRSTPVTQIPAAEFRRLGREGPFVAPSFRISVISAVENRGEHGVPAGPGVL